jgi:hypothetical protein
VKTKPDVWDFFIDRFEFDSSDSPRRAASNSGADRSRVARIECRRGFQPTKRQQPLRRVATIEKMPSNVARRRVSPPSVPAFLKAGLHSIRRYAPAAINSKYCASVAHGNPASSFSAERSPLPLLEPTKCHSRTPSPRVHDRSHPPTREASDMMFATRLSSHGRCVPSVPPTQ